jgi:hypothetical protein
MTNAQWVGEGAARPLVPGPWETITLHTERYPENWHSKKEEENDCKN